MESIYRDLEMKYGSIDRTLPGDMIVRPLRVSDADAVLALEQAAFPENERATKEKLVYRLHECPELTAGVFTRSYTWAAPANDDAGGVAAPSSAPVKETLVAHIIATKMTTKAVSDEAMQVPELAANGLLVNPNDKRGHVEAGRTIGIHSLAVSPSFQGKSIGYLMLKDYIQRLYSLDTADGIGLLAHPELLKFYEKHGFRDEGVSQCEFGGSKWQDLYLPFDTYDNKPLE